MNTMTQAPIASLRHVAVLARIICSCLFLSGSSFALSQPLQLINGFRPKPAVDSRGFIDVWQLRRDVAAIEPLIAYEDTDSCYSEGDPDSPELTEQEVKDTERIERECVARAEREYAAYRRVFDSFNKAWLPALVNAARRGDKVAEVILRQCDTTPVIDRRRIESTCDEDPARRAIAIQRLQKTGFEPAYAQELGAPPGGPLGSRDAAQMEALQMYLFGLLKQGIFGRIDVSSATNVDPEKNNAAAVRGEVIEAALQEVERAFTFSGNYYVNAKTDEFATLRLNRKPLTPGFMTRGKELLDGDGTASGVRLWRWGLGIEIGRVDEFVGSMEEAEFIKQLREILVTSKRNIDRHLKEDPRWGVFVLSRVGHHEWVPEGMTSETDKLGHEWVGQWKLEKVFKGYHPDWTLVSNPPEATRARIYREGGVTRIAFQSEDPPRAPLQDAVGCQLRYSGGLTFIPSSNSDDSVSTETVFGYEGAYPIPMLREVYKPLKPTNRYRQVLVQCPEGEWFDNLRTRHLFLAGNTMIERASEGRGMTVRHFRRVDESESPSLNLAQPAEAATKQSPESATGRVLERLAADEAAAVHRADQARKKMDRLEKAGIAELIASLRTSRNENLYYDKSAFPPNLKEIERRKGHVAELAAAYHAEKNDPVFRFNIVMILSHKLEDGTLLPGERDAIGKCLLDSLRDPSAWVRTEAVWGLRFTDDSKYLDAVKALEKDPDPYVQSEASTTASQIQFRSPRSK
ncbi:MAG: HEAT repeat domain-containing protein [Thiobacillus sp.]|nr:HEAT repeat domain-containing protein [Thiobacillus sp.]